MVEAIINAPFLMQNITAAKRCEIFHKLSCEAGGNLISICADTEF